MNETLWAMNRFGLGARLGETRGVTNPRAWLKSQLDADPAKPDEGVDLDEAGEAFRALRTAQRGGDQAEAAAARRRLRELTVTEANAMLRARVMAEAPFIERLVAFWSNHLCVSITAKPQISAMAGHYERTVVRPHVLGRFEEMVLASARHPAMLFYLDNFQSMGPESPAGRRTARRGNARGLNENYARELLELHTVGVDGGYDQDDVEALARILTGWSVSGVGPGAPEMRNGVRPNGGNRTGRRGPGRLTRPPESDEPGFVFREMIHEPGEKTVMGVRYEEAGVREGERVIRDLCAHPSTASFVSEKLVRHFVSDDPPPDAVDRIASVFRESDGDLREVSAALVDLEEAWDPEHRKFRTPQEWLVAVFRAFRADEVPEQATGVLRQLRHTPWAPASPKGYGDTRDEWADPDSIMSRAELSRSLARRLGERAERLRPEMLLELIDVREDDPLRELLADSSIPGAERIALGIGGPAFQWR